ncbi:MAG: hypothetical protein ACK514_18430 [Bacteroidota bacterium]|jgi:hypothetical protein|nr:hypothetical protein [Cytophagales bacterium]MCE2956296.1 hypothetical protein [Flammeovirgaceae bacterium]MCZ8070553.1 hypothetical protein [Cytophagales bacterium]
MKRLILVLPLVIGLSALHAQEVGLSFSYFIPKNGDFSTPISPFSIRGIGVNLNRFIALETGASLYRMSGLNIKDLPFESRNSLLGPNFTILIPAELVFQLKGQRVEFDIKGGGFFFYGFGQNLNYGNIDRAIRELEKWDVANAALTYENNPGFGYHFGAELTIPVTSQVSVSLETNYLLGAANFPLKGSYTGGSINGTTQTKAVDYKDAKVDFTGLEFSIGLMFNTGGGGGGKPKPRRRR